MGVKLKNKNKMKTIQISGSTRTEKGKKSANDLRRKGHVPCVVYGGKEVIHFSAPEPAFKNLVYTPDALKVEIDVDGKKINAIMQDIQFNKVSDKIQHIDFIELVAGKSVVMNLPVKTTGTAPGVREGGKLLKKMRTVKVKGPIGKIPGEVVLNIDKMQIGDSTRVGDIKIDGLQLLDNLNMTVIAVRVTRAVEEEAPAAAAVAAPAAGATPAAAAPAAPAADAAKKPEAKK